MTSGHKINLNLNKVRTHYLEGDFFHPDWSCLTFQKLIMVWNLEWNWPLVKTSILNLNKVRTLRVIFSSWLVLSDLLTNNDSALNHKLTSGHKFEPEQGSNPLPLGWVSHPDWSCLTIQQINSTYPWNDFN